VQRARSVLQRIELLKLDDELLDLAAGISPGMLRTLDAIHLAACLTLLPAVHEIVSYDIRLAYAAEQHGLTVVAPGKV
jgi:predicted nucleic acid-binding protein